MMRNSMVKTVRFAKPMDVVLEPLGDLEELSLSGDLKRMRIFQE